MEKIQQVLDSYSANGDDTQNKILGATFTVVDKDGKHFRARWESLTKASIRAPVPRIYWPA